jgi:hypothetical protein
MKAAFSPIRSERHGGWRTVGVLLLSIPFFFPLIGQAWVVSDRTNLHFLEGAPIFLCLNLLISACCVVALAMQTSVVRRGVLSVQRAIRDTFRDSRIMRGFRLMMIRKGWQSAEDDRAGYEWILPARSATHRV